MKLQIKISLVLIILSFIIDAKQSSDWIASTSSSRKSASTAATDVGEIKYHYLNEKDFPGIKAVSSHGRDDKDIDEKPVSSIAVALRSAYLLLIFSPIIVSSPLAYIFPFFRNVIWYKLLCNTIGTSGAAFIKWGQWSSTRPDMFPEELCVALSQLHSKAPVHGFDFTKNQIYTEFGETVTEMFESFSEKPIASGSIAQVYRARLDGKDVAVKVRHPNVVEQIQIGKCNCITCVGYFFIYKD